MNRRISIHHDPGMGTHGMLRFQRGTEACYGWTNVFRFGFWFWWFYGTSAITQHHDRKGWQHRMHDLVDYRYGPKPGRVWRTLIEWELRRARTKELRERRARADRRKENP
jgi:hypothetical protein